MLLLEGTGKSRNKETRNETKRHFKVERSWRSCACAPSLMVLPDRKGSEYPRSIFSSRLMPQGKGGGGELSPRSWLPAAYCEIQAIAKTKVAAGIPREWQSLHNRFEARIVRIPGDP